MEQETQQEAARWRILLEEAANLGLYHVACAKAASLPEHELFTAWLAAELAGDMTYLARDAEPRRDPRRLFERARSVVCVALSYAYPDALLDASAASASAEDTRLDLRGQIARYARSEDYHLVLKRRLQVLAQRVLARFGEETKEEGVAYRTCVDTAPLLERAWAQRSGLGFVGKNTLLIVPRSGVGSYTVLGELLLPFDLPAGQSLGSRCGSCRMCLDACPTQAFIDAFRLDARRCISYLTIENKGPIPLPLRRAIGTWIFGCDICQEVCPYNKSPAPKDGIGSCDVKLVPRPNQSRPQLVWLLGLGAAQFRRFVVRTALRRIGRSQLLRNVAVALGNIGTANEVPALLAALAKEPALVRQHVAWALGEIALRDAAARAPALQALRTALAKEPEAETRAELEQAIAAIEISR